MMNIAYLSAEAAPFSKTGGLADVAGSLPHALNRKEDVRAILMTPLHECIEKCHRDRMEFVGSTEVRLGWRIQYVGIFRSRIGDTDIYFIDNEFYFRRGRIFGEFDDGERYAFFSMAALAAIKFLLLPIDIVHINDWHTAAIAPLLDFYRRHDAFYRSMRVVYTIHNLRYQGIFPRSFLSEILGLPDEYYSENGLKFYEDINLMKGAIVFSDRVTTVSPSYAQEILYPFFGEGLDGLLRAHSGKLRGILNGIDYTDFNPAADDRIAHHYDFARIEGKIPNKRALQTRLGLPVDEQPTVVSMVTRLTDAKGLDLVEAVFPDILRCDVQFVLLGTGEERYHRFFGEWAHRCPEKVSAQLYFDEGLARLIYAGSDVFLMPSLYEPCGLSQMIAQRYGALPLVREIGGLRDSVRPYNQFTGEGNGFSFANYNAHEMLHVLEYVVELHRREGDWNRLVRQAMELDNSWGRSARLYHELYYHLIHESI